MFARSVVCDHVEPRALQSLGVRVRERRSDRRTQHRPCRAVGAAIDPVAAQVALGIGRPVPSDVDRAIRTGAGHHMRHGGRCRRCSRIQDHRRRGSAPCSRRRRALARTPSWRRSRRQRPRHLRARHVVDHVRSPGDPVSSRSSRRSAGTDPRRPFQGDVRRGGIAGVGRAPRADREGTGRRGGVTRSRPLLSSSSRTESSLCSTA